MVCIFVIFGAFISLNIYRYGFKKAFLNLNLLIFTGLSLLPFILYFLYGYFVLGFLKGEVQGRILIAPIMAIQRLLGGVAQSN